MSADKAIAAGSNQRPANERGKHDNDKSGSAVNARFSGGLKMKIARALFFVAALIIAAVAHRACGAIRAEFARGTASRKLAMQLQPSIMRQAKHAEMAAKLAEDAAANPGVASQIEEIARVASASLSFDKRERTDLGFDAQAFTVSWAAVKIGSATEAITRLESLSPRARLREISIDPLQAQGIARITASFEIAVAGAQGK